MTDPNAWQMPTFYTKEKENELRYKFPGVELVSHQNFSQCYQDMFVLCMTDGRPKGTFVEIGAGHPVISNNTALLESRFEWDGIGFEIKEHEANCIINIVVQRLLLVMLPLLTLMLSLKRLVSVLPLIICR